MRFQGGGGGGGVALMAPAWPSCVGREDQGARLPGGGGALTSRPRAEIHLTRNQEPDDTSILSKTRRGRGRDTEAQRDPRRSNTPGADRDLGAVQGQQMGEHTIT